MSAQSVPGAEKDIIVQETNVNILSPSINLGYSFCLPSSIAAPLYYQNEANINSPNKGRIAKDVYSHAEDHKALS